MENTKKYLSMGLALVIALCASVEVSASQQRRQGRGAATQNATVDTFALLDAVNELRSIVNTTKSSVQLLELSYSDLYKSVEALKKDVQQLKKSKK